jgi:hypothetical protein
MPVSNPSATFIQDEGAAQGAVRTLNFTGSGVTASVSGGVATIAVTSGGGGSGAIDGGAPNSTYGGTTAIDGGTP